MKLLQAFVSGTGFLKEITKNIPKFGTNTRCNYSVLPSADDSTESLLRTNDEDESPNLPKSHSSYAFQLCRIPRDPVSVPNFRALSPTSEDGRDLKQVDTILYIYNVVCIYKNINIFRDLNRKFRPNGEQSYSSHLCDGDDIFKSASVRFKETKLSEDSETTSDYASAETVNRLNEQPGLFGFCNPHYLGPDVQQMLKRNDDDIRAQQVF